MSLPKKDVRASISVEAHEVLTAIADLEDKDIGDQASYLLERALLGEVHAARLLAERAARFGKVRQLADAQRRAPENPGSSRREVKPGSRE